MSWKAGSHQISLFKMCVPSWNIYLSQIDTSLGLFSSAPISEALAWECWHYQPGLKFDHMLLPKGGQQARIPLMWQYSNVLYSFKCSNIWKACSNTEKGCSILTHAVLSAALLSEKETGIWKIFTYSPQKKKKLLPSLLFPKESNIKDISNIFYFSPLCVVSYKLYFLFLTITHKIKIEN